MTDHDRQPESLALPPVAPALPDLSALSFIGGDLSEHFKRFEERTRRRNDEDVVPSLLSLPDFVALSAEDSLDLGEDGDDLLDDARANIARGEYALALEQLAEFLEISPGHAEARYLQAYCHYQLGNLMTALEILRPMRDEPLEEALTASVRELRTTLRRVLTPKEMTAFLDGYPVDPQGAGGRMRHFIKLAPEEPEPPYMLAVTQALDGEFEPALRTAQAGLKQAEGDVRQLRAIADVLAILVVRPLVEPVITAIFDGAYQRAKQKLARLDREWRETQLVQDLETFVEDLRGHPSAKPLPAPRGPADRVNRLYALLTDKHGRQAVELMSDGRFAEAERVTAKMLHVVPHFPPANYVYAFCLCIEGHEPERAIAAAEIAVRDPSLPDAKMLLRRAKEMPEVLAIKAAFDEHNNAMRKVGREPTSQEFTSLRRTMEGLRARMPQLRAMASNRHNRKLVRDLEQAVDQRIVEIDTATRNMAVNAVVLRFNRWAEQASASRSRSPLDDLLYGRPAGLDMTELRAIGQQARAVLGTTTDPQARRVLRELLDAIDRIYRSY